MCPVAGEVGIIFHEEAPGFDSLGTVGAFAGNLLIEPLHNPRYPCLHFSYEYGLPVLEINQTDGLWAQSNAGIT